MLYFCSVLDIKSILPAAARFEAQMDAMRKAVTEDMNAYMRRNLEYVENAVEYFDTYDVGPFGTFNVWLEKRAIEQVAVTYSLRRTWDDDGLIIDPAMITLSPKGRVIIPGPTRPGRGSLRIVYSGGFKPVPAANTDPEAPVTYTDVMQAPSALKQACIDECVYRLDKLLNINVGNKEDVDKRQKVAQTTMVAGLLGKTAATLQEYRKPLGAVNG